MRYNTFVNVTSEMQNKTWKFVCDFNLRLRIITLRYVYKTFVTWIQLHIPLSFFLLRKLYVVSLVY